MSDNTGTVIVAFIFFGWIPILALGSAISNIIRACKSNENKIEEGE